MYSLLCGDCPLELTICVDLAYDRAVRKLSLIRQSIVKSRYRLNVHVQVGCKYDN